MQEPLQQRSRLQFSIRFVLLVMVIIGVALGVTVYFYEPPVRPISASQAKQIKVGMSQRQVMAILGSPFGKSIGERNTFWSFDYDKGASTGYDYLDIWFDDAGYAIVVKNGVKFDLMDGSRLYDTLPDGPAE